MIKVLLQKGEDNTRSVIVQGRRGLSYARAMAAGIDRAAFKAVIKEKLAKVELELHPDYPNIL